MERKRITVDPERFPGEFRPLLQSAPVYDSSCSTAARVYFIDRDEGYYLKTSPVGTLQKEAELTRFFHGKGLGPRVLACTQSEGRDWLLTARVPGEDCTHPLYMAEPTRLCDTLAELLRRLHDTDPTGCPMANRTADYLAAARRNYEAGRYDVQLFPPPWRFKTVEEAWRIAEEQGRFLRADTLLHGDYCLPNVMLQDWRFSGFIDLGTGGVGDRHVDLFWATWSLNYNLKTDRYRERFLDVYGRDKVQPELFPVIAAIEVFE